MTQHMKLYIAHVRLIGEFTGTLKGLLWHNITDDVKVKLQARIDELEAIDISEYMPKQENKTSYDQISNTNNKW